MTEILLHRLARNSQLKPERKFNKTYEWNGGVFNCRNISDRDYLFTNIRPAAAQRMHEFAVEKPAAYLLEFSDSATAELRVWALPEPLMNDWLSKVRISDGGQKHELVIHPKEQRIHN